MFNQESEYIGHYFRKSLIKMEYRIISKPITSGNLTSNVLLEWIHQVLWNLVWKFNIAQNYVDKDDPWSGILAAAPFEICLPTNRLKVYSLGQLLFVRDMIRLIKHKVDW